MQTMYDIQKLVEKLPDNVLMQEANKPSGRLPVPMVISEMTRRKQLRIASQGQQAAQEMPRQMAGMADGGSPTDLKKMSRGELKRLLTLPGATPEMRKAIMLELSDRASFDRDVPPSKRRGDMSADERAARSQGLPALQTEEPGLWEQFKEWAGNTGPKQPDWRTGDWKGQGRAGDLDPGSDGRAAMQASGKPSTSQGSSGGGSSKRSGSGSPKGAVSGAISFPQESAYPAYQDPYAAVIAELSKERNLSNPFDAAVADQKKYADAKPGWGEAGMAAAAALLSTPGNWTKGLGAAFGAALPVLQGNRREQRDEQKYLQQLGLQQAQMSQQNENTKFDQRLRAAEAQGNQIKGKQDYGLGALDYGLKKSELDTKNRYYDSEIGKNNAYSNYLASGGSQGSGGTKGAATLFAAYQKALSDAKEQGLTDQEAKAAALDAMRNNPFLQLFGLDLGGGAGYSADMDASELFPE